MGAICDHLQEVARGGIRKLLINVPPGFAKSKLTSVLWPAWRWTTQPAWRLVAASYADALVTRDALGARTLMEGDWYQRSFVLGRSSNGAPLWEFDPSQNTKSMYVNTMTGGRLSISVGSKATGLRGSCVVVDDPINVKEALSEATRKEVIYWWDYVMPMRLDDLTRDTFVVIMQRCHEDDLAGHLGANDESGTTLRRNGWEWLCLPMEYERLYSVPTYVKRDRAYVEHFRDPRTEEAELLCPERVPRCACGVGMARDAQHDAACTPTLEELKKSLGPDGTAGQLQQRPTAATGGMFQRPWWRFWRPDGSDTATFGKASVRLDPQRWPRPRHCTEEPAKVLPPARKMLLFGTIDCAVKGAAHNDHVAVGIAAVHGAEVYLLRVIAAPMDFRATRALVKDLADEWTEVHEWVVEDKANGPAVVNDLREVVPGLVELTPEGGKEARAAVMQPRVYAGQFFLPDGADWVESFVDQFAKFPRGSHDDQVDMASQLVVHLRAGASDLQRLLGMVGG